MSDQFGTESNLLVIATNLLIMLYDGFRRVR